MGLCEGPTGPEGRARGDAGAGGRAITPLSPITQDQRFAVCKVLSHSSRGGRAFLPILQVRKVEALGDEVALTNFRAETQPHEVTPHPA